MRKNLYPGKALRDNRGVSLVELIISIMILVLIMLPLMNGFYRSAILNKKARTTQEQSNLAANIMEGLRNYNIADTITEFTKSADEFGIISLNGDADLRILQKTESGYRALDYTEYDTKEERDALSKQTTLYLAINGIRTGSSAFDALITLDAAPYRGDDILNSYAMPDIINLNTTANGLMFSDGRMVKDGAQEKTSYDEDAFDTFKQLGWDYAESLYYQSDTYQNAYAQYMNDKETALTPIPTPPELAFNPSAYPQYCDEATLKHEITKTMKITVNQNEEDGNNIQYDIVYTCNWPEGCSLNDTLQYFNNSVKYPNPVENVYLFYEPSIFNTALDHSDFIEIDSKTPDNELNFFLIRQQESGSTLIPRVEIINKGKEHVEVYTNIDLVYVTLKDGNGYPLSTLNTQIVDTNEKDRIYDAEIKLYQYVDTDNIAEKYQKLVYTLSSAVENNNSDD